VHVQESNTHSFIVKIWLEETAVEDGQVTWRGHITHVPSREQRYLQDLDDIPLFVIPYLEKLGVGFGLRWQVVRYLNHLKLKCKQRSSRP
jgi:hypothetical protein